ncbi:MAG: exonuclease domain-containing protein [Lachnospiraceae bacterium]|nr:exonuclease domain-containing protein [Lachnospiraceae bacterium]
MNYGLLDIEMTCDGKQEDGKFIDDGRMKRSQREIISVGFVVCNDIYNIKREYSSFVKPVHNTTITDYCTKLTGITQSDVDHGKKCNNAFRDISEICKRYSIDYIFTFGNADKDGIMFSAKWNKKEKEKVNNLYVVSQKIIDVRPAILKGIHCKNYRKGPSLSKIAEMLEIKIKGVHHNALNDAMLLYEICRKLNIQVDYVP